MIWKKIFTILFFILVVFFSVFIIYKTNEQKLDANSAAVKYGEKILGKGTPEFLSKPIIIVTFAIEKFRTDMGNDLENSPFSFFSFIFNNQIVFYGICLVIFFLLVRSIWRVIF
ncbi:MAG TPA: hypothetical protein VK675_04165 [Candidatus Paceibacterota bacterium]|nr:hypothetical protein [Candidatus Paceibacterota bacterium]